MRITFFYFLPEHRYAHFAQQITKYFQNIFNIVTKQKQKLKHKTHYVTFQFRQYMCKLPNFTTRWIMRLVHLAIYTRLAICAYFYSLSGSLCGLDDFSAYTLRVYRGKRVWQSCAFVSASVNVFLYYNCIERFRVLIRKRV